MVLDAVNEKVMEKLEDTQVLLSGELYLPKGLKTTITYKSQSTAVQGRRLTARRASTVGAVLTLEIENEGPTSVAPVDVAQELQKQVKSSSTGAMKALADLGTVNTKVGVRVASEKATVTTRADVAKQQGKAALGISHPTTTSRQAGQGQVTTSEAMVTPRQPAWMVSSVLPCRVGSTCSWFCCSLSAPPCRKHHAGSCKGAASQCRVLKCPGQFKACVASMCFSGIA